MNAPVTEENPYAGQGSVLLDIGGDVGALVVRMPAATVGTEVEVRRVGGAVHDGGHGHGHAHGHEHPGAHLPHVAVVERPTGAGAVPSLVFGELVEGTYELLDKGGDEVRLTADVRGGAVTELGWPA